MITFPPVRQPPLPGLQGQSVNANYEIPHPTSQGFGMIRA